MIKMIKKALPQSESFIRACLRLAIINLVILFLVIGGSFLMFLTVEKIRLVGIPMPKPIWLILLGTSIPCFILWFRYGKVFGSFVPNKAFKKGIGLIFIGNIPGIAIISISLLNYSIIIGDENFRILLIILVMHLIMMPLMTIMGFLDSKKGSTRK